MYIKNQIFRDEETLLEMLFDFSLGKASDVIQQYIQDIFKDIESNSEYIKYRASLQDEDDKAEFKDEECRLRLAEILAAHFDLFEVKRPCLYGVKDGKHTLLYEIDLY